MELEEYYILVDGENLDYFVGRASDLIATGWLPAGGVLITTGGKLYQAFYRVPQVASQILIMEVPDVQS
jgi:hypothetical protein